MTDSHDHNRRETDRKSEERLDRMEDTLTRMEQILTPISETYTTATTVGKWFMGFLVFVSLMVGIGMGLKNLFHR